MNTTITVNRVLAIAGLICAILALVGLGGIPWLAIAVILLALALII